MPSAGRQADPAATKAERAYFELRRSIANGTIAPGTAFDQEQLARDLRMSTTPLRETLRRLESEGFVELNPHRDVHVRPLSEREMRELYEVRMALEPHATRLAAKVASDSDVAVLRREIARRPARVPELAEHYQEVHRLLYAGCGNDYLVAVLDRLNDRLGRYRARFLPLEPELLDLVETFHATAADAFEARDGDALATIVGDHLGKVMKGLVVRGEQLADARLQRVPAPAAGGAS